MKTHQATDKNAEMAETTVVNTAQKTSPIGQVLTPDQKKAQLKKCEDEIQQNEAGPFITGRNLNAIHEKSLYRVGGYTTFPKYCRSRWGMSDKQAYRLMNAARCYDVLAAHQGEAKWTLPRNESQIRPLTQFATQDNVANEKVIAAWKKVMKKFYGKAMTAEDIEAVVNPKSKTSKNSAGTAAAAVDAANEPATELQNRLARIDELVDGALKKSEDADEIPVRIYRELLNQIKELTEVKKLKLKK